MMAGQVVHFELPFDDVERAKAFYGDVFGWSLVDMAGMAYTIANTTPTDDAGMPTQLGAINGGMQQRGGPVSAPVLTIQVDDIDEALASITKHGGSQVQGRQAVGEMGFTGYFADPEGNVVGLWQNKPAGS
jgi:predicted enzyme related to lactoylglutathione lyase